MEKPGLPPIKTRPGFQPNRKTTHMTDTVKASAYIIIKASRNQYKPRDKETGLRPIDGAKIIAARQAPVSLDLDEVLIKVSVQLPASVFDPITPAALIIVPEDLILARHEIEAEAVEDGMAAEDSQLTLVLRTLVADPRVSIDGQPDAVIVDALRVLERPQTGVTA